VRTIRESGDGERLDVEPAAKADEVALDAASDGGSPEDLWPPGRPDDVRIQPMRSTLR